MRRAPVFLALLLIISLTPALQAGFPRIRRARTSPTRYEVRSPSHLQASAPADTAESPYLGTFYPTPYVTVRGNNPVGGGYSPNGMYGSSNLTIYGPMSIYRQVAAPVVTYQRGYDGVVRASVGTSFSNPNLPGVNPVVYPTRGDLYYAPRTQRTPPGLDSGTSFIDQN